MRRFRDLAFAVAGAASVLALSASAARADNDDPFWRGEQPYKHVLLISVDGMHSIDLTRWVDFHPFSNFAKLARSGVTYRNAFTTGPSDSFPGMLAQVSGATPKTGGLHYDDSYDRTEYPSKAFYASQGLTDPGCVGNPGTEITNFEELDRSYDFSTGLVKDYTGGGKLGKVETQLDTANMQRKIIDGKCEPMYPHMYVRTNTIFEVIKAASRRTAWSDKHAAYEDLSGPSGAGVDDMFTPEINSQDTLDAGAAIGDDYTKSYTGVRSYDALKVEAVLNWIDGYNSTRTQSFAVPAIFGMNFQAVSVAQKLAKAGAADADKSLIGGYTDAAGTPGTALTINLQFVDDSLGKFMTELAKRDIEKDTMIIVSAKHGQSPINKAVRIAISDSAYANAPGFGANGFEICDDEALVWLSPQLQQATDPATGKKYYEEAKVYILEHASTLHITKLLDRAALTPVFGDPFADSRVPDFIAITEHGAICTGGSKLAEHGGFSNDDRKVALLVSSPRLYGKRVEYEMTYTTQIAPTILDALGISPVWLDAVRNEGTKVLKY